MSDYFKRFTQWQYYAHYVLLALLLTIYYAVWGDFTKSYFSMGVELAIALFFADSLVHAFFWFAKKPIQWRD